MKGLKLFSKLSLVLGVLAILASGCSQLKFVRLKANKVVFDKNKAVLAERNTLQKTEQTELEALNIATQVEALEVVETSDAISKRSIANNDLNASTREDIIVNANYVPSGFVASNNSAKEVKLSKKEIRKAKKAKRSKVRELVKKAIAGGSKGQLITLLLCFFLGGLGVHRFYLGYTWQGVVQLLTAGGCGIWALIDFIRIIMGTLGPADGSSYNPEL